MSPRALLGLAAALTAGLLVESCMDLTPVEVPARLSDGGSVPDGLLGDAASPDANDPCERCLGATGKDGCGDPLAACLADPRCDTLLRCTFEQGCLKLSSTEALACGSPCVTSSGVASLEDPALKALFAFAGCAQQLCHAPCGFAPPAMPADAGAD